MKSAIRKLARETGFDVTGFTLPELPAHAPQGLRAFLGNQHHGEMTWMEEKADRRVSPGVIWPEAKSIIVLGQNYGPESDPMEKLADKNTGNISCYAQGKDYHDVVKKKLKALARAIAKEFSCEVKVFVDTAPVMEKPLAEQAGLGWQGKHTCIVSREFGSWLFLGEIFTTLPLAPDDAEIDHCGSCSACLDICPTNAFVGPHELDARKCISYLTIEHKGHIDMQFRKAIGNRIYGCDDCLAVCPWNKFAQAAQEIAYRAKPHLAAPPLAELVQYDDAGFRAAFSGSPIKRIGRDRFTRNVLIAIGNSGNEDYIKCILPLLRDSSALVRAMAAWALSELASEYKYTTIALEYMPLETDPGVAAEWNRKRNAHG